jgi:hypothetical protein
LGIAAGYGLLTVTGNEHKMMRRAMNPAFSLSNLTARGCIINYNYVALSLNFFFSFMLEVEMYYPPLEGLSMVYRDTLNLFN